VDVPQASMPVVPVDEARVWFAMAGRERVGPLSVTELGSLRQAGALEETSFVWRPGMEAGTPLAVVAAVMAALVGVGGVATAHIVADLLGQGLPGAMIAPVFVAVLVMCTEVFSIMALGLAEFTVYRAMGLSPAAAAASLDAVFGLVGGIGVGGAERHRHLLVVLRALILVAHQHRDRCAEGDAIEQAAEDLHLIFLLAGRGDPALARFAPVQFRLDGGQIQLQPRRTAIDDHPDPTAMGFPEGADAEEVAEAAAHGEIVLGGAYKGRRPGVCPDYPGETSGRGGP
jgi:hypothetical protein